MRAAPALRVPRPLEGRLPSPELVLLAVFVVWSLLPFALLFPGSDGVFNGSDGIQVSDHMQYMAWARDAGEHVLFANQFDVVPDRHLFLHPVLALSGLAWQLGASIQLAFLAWKPVAVALLFVGFAAYVRRLVGPGWGARFAALGLALFFFTPLTPVVRALAVDDPALDFGAIIMGLEMFAGAYAWGGFPATISIALVPIFLLAAERLLEPARRAPGRSPRWYALWAGAAGLLSGWLHPWQGLTLLAIVGGAVVWGRFERRYLALAIPVLLTAAPIAYYVALSHTDSSWAFVSGPRDYPHFGWWFFLGLAPALLALPGFRGPVDDLQERFVRLWPLAALAVYFVLNESWFYHAFNGISLPLAVLAVRGWARLRVPRPLLAATALALTVPGMVWIAVELRDTRDQHFFADGERRALEYLESSPREGPVLAALHPLGHAVPAFTGRQTWMGHYNWTPHALERDRLTQALFEGRLRAPRARALVRESTATFVVSDCGRQIDLRGDLRPLLERTVQLGCATVYEVREAARLQAHRR